MKNLLKNTLFSLFFLFSYNIGITQNYTFEVFNTGPNLQLEVNHNTISSAPNRTFPINDGNGRLFNGISYEYLWILSDGSFVKSTEPQIQLNGVAGSLNINNNTNRVYIVPFYNGGPPPPARAQNSIPAPSKTPSASPTIETIENITPINIIDFQLFHPDLCPLDTFSVGVITVQAPDYQDNNLNGIVSLFYNGAVKQGSSKVGNIHFSYNETILNSTLAAQNIYGAIGDYQNSISWNVNLKAQEKLQFFVEFDMDQSLDDKGWVSNNLHNYMSDFLVVFSTPKKGTSGTISSASSFNNTQLTNFPALSNRVNVVDSKFVAANIVSAHDPNNLYVRTCECPELSGERQLDCSIEISNDGDRNASDFILKMAVPPEIDLAKLEKSDITFHTSNYPGVARDFRLEKTSNSFEITLSAKNNVVLGAKEWAFINFPFITTPNIDLNALSPLQACTSFGDNTTWCTNTVKPTTLNSREGKDYNLSCSDHCTNRASATCCKEDHRLLWSILILSIIGLILLIMIYLKIR